MTKKVAIFTSSRADYGILSPLISKVKSDNCLELILIVGGTHLSPDFGNTIDEIKSDGFFIDEKIEMTMSSNSAVGVSKSIGLGVISAAEIFDRLNPDCVILLGDRFETFAVAQAALIARIPIVHLHGGELTAGLIDEPIRHSISKMATLHCVCAEAYRKRVRQLGENPTHIFNVGALSVERIKNNRNINSQQLTKIVNLQLKDSILLVTYHPISLSSDGGVEELKNLLDVLSFYVVSHSIVITYPNADTYSRDIMSLLRCFSEKHVDSVALVSSLGSVAYLSLMAISDVVVGNSSSGFLEAPVLGIPTVNIGPRQRGRLKTDSIFDCDGLVSSIHEALEKAIKLKKSGVSCPHPYGNGNTSQKILELVKEFDFVRVKQKDFFDIEF